MYTYTIIEENGFTRVAATDTEVGYAEVQHTGEAADEAYQATLREFFEDIKAEKIYYENIQPDFTRNFRDEVYMSGEIVRTDYSVDRPEARPKIDQLIAHFPWYTVQELTSRPQHVIGNYGNYRPPYNNDSISYYDFTKPTPSRLGAYGCTTETYGDDLLNWHGIKHDLATLTKAAKFVFTQNHGQYINPFPLDYPTKRAIFWARIHNPDGTVEPWVDAYIISTINYMRDWCDRNNQTFPLPDDVTEQPWCFAIVWNNDTGEISNVKAYIRTSYNGD